MNSEFSYLNGNTKGIVYLIFFRLSSFFTKSKVHKVVGFPIRLFYHFFFQWILGFDVSDTTKIGKSFNVYHGFGIAIHKDTIIGNFVKMRHTTTIGNKMTNGKAPRIGDYVDIGAHCVLIGEIEIGDHVTIGAGSIVTKSIPSYCLAYGNPLKITKKQQREN
jgi:serine acetyltransferase